MSLFVVRAIACHRHRERQKTFRLVASWFSDVRSYDWDLLVSEVSGDLAYTVAIERYTASRNGRPPVPTELRVTQCIGARTDSGGRYTAMPTSSHPRNRRRPDPHRRFHQCLVFDHQPLGFVVGVVLVKVGLVDLEAGNVQGLG